MIAVLSGLVIRLVMSVREDRKNSRNSRTESGLDCPLQEQGLWVPLLVCLSWLCALLMSWGMERTLLKV